MVLNFFGRDAGFGDNHTSAFFFTENNDMVIIDCPVSTYQKLRKTDLRKYNSIYLLITHTHGDHIGGLGLFIQNMHFSQNKLVTIVAPSNEVLNDIKTLLRIEGADVSWYEIIIATHPRVKDWLKNSILTEHTPEMKGRCFGYRLNVLGTNVIYTGDTCTLKPFEPYLSYCGELYVDTSINTGIVHMKLEDSLHYLINLTKSGTKVFLMHLDDALMAEKIVATIHNIEVVTVI